MNSNNFSLKKTGWFCVMTFAVLDRLLDTNKIQLSGVLLLTHRTSAEKLCFYSNITGTNVPLAHADNMESFENMILLLEKKSSIKNLNGTCVD
jgi:hypothetical protein